MVPFLLCAALTGVVPSAGDAAAGGMLRPFLEQHCAECHDADTKKGGLDLAKLALKLDDAASFEEWVKVHDRLRDGEMPPQKKKDRPPAKETEEVLQWLNGQLVAADRMRNDTQGRALFRRLTREEYENTVRDLLALPGLQLKDLLPEDGIVHGFDKPGEALDISHVQLAKYMEAADKALDAAIAWMPRQPELYKERFYPGAEYDFKIVLTNGDAVSILDKHHDPQCVPLLSDKNYEKGLRELEQTKIFPYHGSVGIFRHEDCAFRPRFSSFAPVYPGLYRVRLSVWSYWWDKGEVKPSPKTEIAWLKADSRLIGYFDAPSLEAKVTEATAWMDTGDYITFNAASLIPIRVSERKGRSKEFEGPGIAVDWIDVEGPIIDEWPPQSHKRLFGDLPIQPFDVKSDVRPPRRALLKQSKPGAWPRPQHFQKDEPKLWSVASAQPLEDARRLIGNFAPKAFRRPVPKEELERYVAIARNRLEAKVSFEEAMRTAYKAMLCSPDFLFIEERPGKLDTWALAERLSLFLWNSAPDDLLIEAARNGSLARPDVMRRETERMLKDAKAQRFVENFLDQWLKLRDIEQTTPDKQLYPDFSPCLEDAMVAESRAFFNEMIEKNLSVRNVAASDFAMLNQPLAEHYGIPGVEGSAVREVKLPADSHRGGFLTQASILKVTANGTVTTPVKRGAWVMEKIIGKPIPPPPPDIPAIDPDVRGATTIRDQLDKHRHDAVCASCHAKMDPAGFALESFDVIGGFRTRYRSLGAGDKVEKMGLGRNPVRYKDALPVECGGVLTDGSTFKSVDEFRKLLLRDPDQLARNLARQLLIYATGADVGYADRADVEQIVSAVKKKDYGMRSLIHEIVQSPLFQRK